MSLVLYTHSFLTSLVFTCVVETLVLFLCLRYVFKKSEPIERIIFAGVFGSFATITYVWYVFPIIATWPTGFGLWWAEAFAFVVEAVFYRFFLKLSWRNALIVSLAANAVSFIAGPALRSVGIWVRW